MFKYKKKGYAKTTVITLQATHEGIQIIYQEAWRA